MTLRTPPSWEQNASHPAENDRLTTQALWATTGIINPASLAVTANSPVGMSVRVADGWAAIVGTTQPDMGAYVIYNDATVVLTITTANPTNPRIDLVCATIQDSYYSGALDDVIFQVIPGTPGGSPVAPSLPANSIALAQVTVPAAATSIVTGDIADSRVEVTTNVPVSGDITSVTAGTGLTGGGSSGAVTLAIDSTVATLTGSQTLTNKDLTSGTNTFPTSLVTLTGSQTLTNKTLTAPVLNNSLMKSPEERLTISATAATGTITFDTQTQGILYYTTDATGDFVLDFTNVNANLATGDSISCVFLNTNGATPYYCTGVLVDSGSPIVKWANGTAPTSGNSSAIDTYSFIIIKTGSATFTVLAGGAVKFA